MKTNKTNKKLSLIVSVSLVILGLSIAQSGATEIPTTINGITSCPSGATLSGSTCATEALVAASVATGIPVGPPPSAHYTVQIQPKPGSCHYRYTKDKQPLPDPKCTPGATNPMVTQANISSTICRSGYTKTIRPSSYVTGIEKKANALSYGYTGSLRTWEYDHLIPLEAGGSPNSPLNLWVEPASPGHTGNSVNNPKDSVENKLHTAICSGRITLVRAQLLITQNWTTVLAKI